jgi:hypothetical protein
MGTDMNRHAMNFGAVMGVLFSLNFLVVTIKSVAFLQYLLIVAIIYCAYRFVVDCREKILGRAISYRSALWYVIQLFMYGSMISALVRYLFYAYIKPDYLQIMLNEAMQTLQNSSMASLVNGDVYQQALEMMTPLNMALQTFWTNLILGLLLGLILAGIVKRNENPFSTNIEE